MSIGAQIRLAASGGSPSPLVYARKPKGRSTDPTKTVGLRRDFEREFRRRLNKILKAITQEVVTRNGFGIRDESELIANAGRFDFPTDQAKVAAFQSWFETILNRYLFDGLLSRSFDAARERFWGNTFANIAYRRGLLSAVAQIRRAGGTVSDAYIQGAMAGGHHYDALQKMYTRAFDGLRGITAEMSRQIGAALAETLAAGKGVEAMARAIRDRVESVGRYRSFLLARTEVISAFNEAELNSYADAGLDGVTLQPELLTAGDDRVCPICEDAATRSYTLEEARGLLPLHPNCRCAWAPLIVDGERIRL